MMVMTIYIGIVSPHLVQLNTHQLLVGKMRLNIIDFVEEKTFLKNRLLSQNIILFKFDMINNTTFELLFELLCNHFIVLNNVNIFRIIEKLTINKYGLRRRKTLS